jgi:hypothetical protein
MHHKVSGRTLRENPTEIVRIAEDAFEKRGIGGGVAIKVADSAEGALVINVGIRSAMFAGHPIHVLADIGENLLSTAARSFSVPLYGRLDHI